MKIVITGGPCSGKTTIINRLRDDGYKILEEVAREVIAERNFNRKLDATEMLELQKEIYDRQIKKEIDVDSLEETVFLDRGYVDNHAYCEHHIGYIPKWLLTAPVKRYDQILVFERLPLIKDGIRRESDKEAKQIHDRIICAYKNSGYEPIIVPVMSIEDRTEYVKKAVEKLISEKILVEG